MQRFPAIQLPPVARARALGALVPRGDHAVAFSMNIVDSLLAGYAMEGLASGERVLVLSGTCSPRSMQARLRGEGIAPPAERPAAFQVMSPGAVRVPMPEFLEESAEFAGQDGYEGLRVAHACAPTRLEPARRQELRMPRRFRKPLTLLCVYTRQNLVGTDPAQVAQLAQPHARILCL
jgi:hypothetical protein